MPTISSELRKHPPANEVFRLASGLTGFSFAAALLFYMLGAAFAWGYFDAIDARWATQLLEPSDYMFFGIPPAVIVVVVSFHTFAREIRLSLKKLTYWFYFICAAFFAVWLGAGLVLSRKSVDQLSEWIFLAGVLKFTSVTLLIYSSFFFTDLLQTAWRNKAEISGLIRTIFIAIVNIGIFLASWGLGSANGFLKLDSMRSQLVAEVAKSADLPSHWQVVGFYGDSALLMRKVAGESDQFIIRPVNDLKIFSAKPHEFISNAFHPAAAAASDSPAPPVVPAPNNSAVTAPTGAASSR